MYIAGNGETMKGKKKVTTFFHVSVNKKNSSLPASNFYYTVNHLLLERINNFSPCFELERSFFMLT